MKSQVFNGFVNPTGWAVISDDGRYRYVLGRRWTIGPQIAWVMLNPSTADGEVDDPTIRKCIGFSRSWGYGSLVVVNLFALRSTDPKALLAADDPVGPENIPYVVDELVRSHDVVAAWGASRRPESPITEVVAPWRPYCLGITKSREPRHPLYVPYDTEPIRLSDALAEGEQP